MRLIRAILGLLLWPLKRLGQYLVEREVKRLQSENAVLRQQWEEYLGTLPPEQAKAERDRVEAALAELRKRMEEITELAS